MQINWTNKNAVHICAYLYLCYFQQPSHYPINVLWRSAYLTQFLCRNGKIDVKCGGGSMFPYGSPYGVLSDSNIDFVLLFSTDAHIQVILGNMYINLSLWNGHVCYNRSMRSYNELHQYDYYRKTLKCQSCCFYWINISHWVLLVYQNDYMPFFNSITKIDSCSYSNPLIHLL